MASSVFRGISKRDGSLQYDLVGRDHNTGIKHTERISFPAKWSDEKLKDELRTAVDNFQFRCDRGEVLNRKEEKQKAIEAAREAEKQLTVRQHCDMQLREYTNPNTTKQQAIRFKQFCELYGDYKLIDITPVICGKYMEHLVDRGLKHSTIKEHYTTLKHLFQEAENKEYIAKSPMRAIKLPKQSKEALYEDGQKIEYFTHEEFSRICEFVKGERIETKALIQFLADSACRIGEAAGLKWANVNFTNSTVKIIDNAQLDENRKPKLFTTKSGKSRVVELNAITMGYLRELYRAEQSKPYTAMFVFGKVTTGELMDGGTLGHRVSGFGNRHGMTDIHPHKFRHTWATLAIASGKMSIADVSERLGHASIDTTIKYYVHPTKESSHESLKAVNEAIFGKAVNGND